MDWFMEMFSTLMCNVTMVLVIPIFIHFMYRDVYGEKAALYIKVRLVPSLNKQRLGTSFE